MKKRILHLLASNKYSGAENVACTIINNMSDEYEMCYCSPNGEIEKSLVEKKITFIPLEKLTISEVSRAVEKFSPDIIHAHDFKSSFIASYFYNKSRIISHIHKNDPEMKKISLKSFLYLLTSKRYKKIVGVSESVLDEYIFANKIKSKYITLYNYVDSEKIKKMSNEFNVDQKYDLFYLGRMIAEKNPLEFIEIVNELKNDKIKCVMIGDGPLYDECIQKIKNYNLEENIEMIGFKTNPFPYIKKCTIGVMPSKYEGFGLTAIEALVLEKVVLNSGAGGLKEIFKELPEYICYNRIDYVNKIKEYLDNPIISNLSLERFCNKKVWKNELFKIYGE